MSRDVNIYANKYSNAQNIYLQSACNPVIEQIDW